MINKVILIGNVGADPEIRTLESGVKMARIRVATTERIYNREAQESRDHTEWHSVVLWWQRVLFGRRVSAAAASTDAGCSGGESRRPGRPSVLTAVGFPL